MTNALAPSRKVQSLPHSQLSLVQVVLVHIGRRVHSHELVEVLAIVGDITRHLRQQLAHQHASCQYCMADMAFQSIVQHDPRRNGCNIDEFNGSQDARCWIQTAVNTAACSMAAKLGAPSTSLEVELALHAALGRYDCAHSVR